MNQLVWKEWREQRTTLFAAPLIVWMLVLGYYFIDRHGLYGQNIYVVLDSGSTKDLLFAAWLLSAALCGATMMAPEVGSGTLRLLSMLPISRARIWGTKLLSSAGLLVSCIAASTLAYVALCALLRGMHLFDTPISQLFQDSSSVGIVAALCLLVFAVGCYATMLLDRTISAVTGTILGGVAVIALLSALADKLNSEVSDSPNYDAALFIIWLLFAALLLGLSYRTFQIGETLKTSKRFTALLLPRWFSNVVLIGVTLVIAYYWIMSF